MDSMDTIQLVSDAILVVPMKRAPGTNSRVLLVGAPLGARHCRAGGGEFTPAGAWQTARKKTDPQQLFQLALCLVQAKPLSLFGEALASLLKSDICALILDTTDHGSITVVFRVPDVVPNVDWTPSPEHACGMGRCASRLSLIWKHEQQLVYVEELEKNLEMPVQLEVALEAGNIDTACFCLRSWIMQAASEHTVGMCRVQGCVFKRTEKQGIRMPV
eukprot:1137359-Pelagomonas_calceolata.AAC.2